MSYQKQAEDPSCSNVMEYIKSGWPRKQFLQYEMIPLWKLRSSLMVNNNLLLFNNGIVIPTPLRKDVMERIHQGHQGIEHCRMRVRSSVWWPSINKLVTEMVRNYHVCAKATTPRKEPLISTPLPDFSCKVIGTDFV